MAQSQPIWSRFVRFEAEDGKIYCGEPVDEELDVGIASLTPSTTPILVNVLDSSSPLDLDAKFTGERLKAKTAELHFEIPSDPAIFLKPSSTLSGPTSPIIIPKTLTGIDFEVELAVIIGRTCKNATVANALGYVLGYTVSNDVSARGVQFQTTQFCYAKGFDGFAPLGPVVVAAKRIPDPQVMEVKTVLNGEEMQKSNTRNMIFSVAQIVAHLSRGSTLPAGTVIMTGTPGGIGHSRAPPVYLKEGADLRISISHGLGTLVNPIVDEENIEGLPS
ncbi:hypothetical protein AJ79_09351 [Helicocarpus griseus UAMH5409]|uniref:Fumarylacetoacetase-like C-terminal domain-containing protein n=1 Tax=Helicocarpus griseus UAMH5409 TaxID=1447875 RepID=A0A2B7WKP2_9EURO|nr:hypothetical protein AJ79_09351 [Helicocarpus griseus UAMH5409]